ncbi:MAG: MATE family efflux transporter [Clostridia bacterium]
MKIQLSEHFGYGKLLRFVLPSIGMMIFTSIYSVVDGLFVSNFVGKTSFAAVNLIMPVLMVLGTVGFMIGAGGSAIVAKTMGEGKNEKANEYFTMLILTALAAGFIFLALGQTGLRPIAKLLGAEGKMLENCVLYGRIIICALPALMLQNVFQSFLIAAEKPNVGLAMTVAAGVTNMVLDFLLVAVLRLGIAGAAAATAVSQLVGGIAPVIYFLCGNNCKLRFARTRFYGRVLLKTFANGSSELMTNVSMSLVGMLYNFQLMRIAGENGVAAYGVIMYVGFIFAAVFIGYSIGSAPIISYHYGADNRDELKNLFKKSVNIVSLLGVAMLVLSVSLAAPMAKIFVGYDKELMEMTARGLSIYALSFIVCGHNIFGSAFFTALNNGFVSAMISFLRTFVFQIIVVLILPALMGLDGVWLGVTVAELLAFIVTITFFVTQRKRYNYA